MARFLSRRFVLFLALTTVWGGFPTSATAQEQDEENTQGVYVDTDRVLRSRDAADERLRPRRRKRGQERSLVYLSLPRLLARVRKRREAGRGPTERMRRLRGVTDVEGVFVFPDAEDLVLAGRTDPQRCPVRLATLVEALSRFGPGSSATRFGCSIELTRAALRRMVRRAKRIGPIRPSQRQRLATELARAVGTQKIRYWGLSETSPMARTCVRADYVLKKLALGLLRSPVRGVRSELSMASGDRGLYQRWWFEADREHLLVGDEGKTYGLRGTAMTVRTSGTKEDDGDAAESARRFARQVDGHVAELAGAFPAFDRLDNAVDAALVAALVRKDALHDRVGWDLTWLRRHADGLVPDARVPTKAEPLVNYEPREGKVALAVGGVSVDVSEVVGREAREQAKNKAVGLPRRRPSGRRWFATPRSSSSDR